MTNPLSRESSRVRRAAAFCVALLCFWMATIGVVCHSDDLRFGGSSSTRAVFGHALAAAGTADACAACQWLACTQTVPRATAMPTTPHTFLPWSYLVSCHNPVSQASAQNGSRAPPSA